MTETLRAAAWMGGTVLSFSAMAIAGREASIALDTFEIMLFRSLVGIVIVTAIAAAAGRLHEIRTDRLGLHALRNASHFAGQNLWFFALTGITFAEVFAMEFTTPLWAILLAPLVLGERIDRRQLLAAGIAFAGILMVARPSPERLDPALLAAAGCAVGFALSALFTRRLTRDQSVTCILFWLTVMQAGLGLAFAGADGDIALPTADALPWLGVVSVGGLTAHFCLTQALARAPAATVMPVDFLRLPLIAVLGALFYDETLHPMVFAGATLIIAANWANLRISAQPGRA